MSSGTVPSLLMHVFAEVRDHSYNKDPQIGAPTPALSLFAYETRLQDLGRFGLPVGRHEVVHARRKCRSRMPVESEPVGQQRPFKLPSPWASPFGR